MSAIVDETGAGPTDDFQSEALMILSDVIWSRTPPNQDPTSKDPEYKQIVVFGDSYSAMPGTWTHQLETLSKSRHSVDCYAISGQTARGGLPGQVNIFLAQGLKMKGIDSLPSQTTLYVIWIGINDCAYISSEVEAEERVELIFDAVRNLHDKAAARHFMLFDLPAIERSPIGVTFANADPPRDISHTYLLWNKCLLARAKTFFENPGISEDTTGYIFSARNVINEVLDHPGVFRLRNNDPMTEPSSKELSDLGSLGALSDIWEDHLHLSADVHTILAERLVETLDF